jgi:hypothetical protein
VRACVRARAQRTLNASCLSLFSAALSRQSGSQTTLVDKARRRRLSHDAGEDSSSTMRIRVSPPASSSSLAPLPSHNARTCAYSRGMRTAVVVNDTQTAPKLPRQRWRLKRIGHWAADSGTASLLHAIACLGQHSARHCLGQRRGGGVMARVKLTACENAWYMVHGT